MKRILIFSIITFFLYAGMRAQSVDIDEVLRRIEANNKELQANAQLITCLLYTSPSPRDCS